MATEASALQSVRLTRPVEASAAPRAARFALGSSTQHPASPHLPACFLSRNTHAKALQHAVTATELPLTRFASITPYPLHLSACNSVSRILPTSRTASPTHAEALHAVAQLVQVAHRTTQAAGRGGALRPALGGGQLVRNWRREE